MEIAIIDYGMGNIASVKNSIDFLGHSATLVEDPIKVNDFNTIILPGVGAYGQAMNKLATKGMNKVILDAADKGKKIIGICLGMQLLLSKSFEFGVHDGLGLIEGEVLSMIDKTQLRVPHMGWNDIKSVNIKFNGFNGDYYFVHSYYCQPSNKKDILFETEYGFNFCSAVKKNNIYGLQFHPEKSQKNGLNLLNYILSDD